MIFFQRRFSVLVSMFKYACVTGDGGPLLGPVRSRIWIPMLFGSLRTDKTGARRIDYIANVVVKLC